MFDNKIFTRGIVLISLYLNFSEKWDKEDELMLEIRIFSLQGFPCLNCLWCTNSSRYAIEDSRSLDKCLVIIKIEEVQLIKNVAYTCTCIMFFFTHWYN